MKWFILVTAFTIFSIAKALALEVVVSKTELHIPPDVKITLDGPSVISVDEFRLDGLLATAGNSLKVNADVIEIGPDGNLQGYDADASPTQPPKVESFSRSAEQGAIPANQLTGAWYIGGTGAGGANGKDGIQGSDGTAGNQSPGPVLLASRILSVLGKIELFGQSGSKGGEGQDGQDGGSGAPGRNASCGRGKTSCHCYSGSTKSGPGGIGGLGGAGGKGGAGGAAIPLLILSLYKSDFKNAPISLPGERGMGGDPGNHGQIGPVGSEGRSCSAKAKWGSAFCSCSVPGGARTGNQIDDDRLVKNGGTGPLGDPGNDVNWSNANLYDLKARLPLLSPNVGEISFSNGDVSAHVIRQAIIIELTGRLAVTVRSVIAKYEALSESESKKKLLEEAIPKLQVVARKLESLESTVQGVSTFLSAKSENDYYARLNLVPALLRDSFIQQKAWLMARCAELETTTSAYLGVKSKSYFPREFAVCSPEAFSWVPFVLDRKEIELGVRQANIPDAMLKYFKQAKQPAIENTIAYTNNGLAIREFTGISQQMLNSRTFLKSLQGGSVEPAKIKLGGDAASSIAEELSLLGNDLESFSVGADNEFN